MSEFMRRYKLKNLIKHKTCFKNPENPPCIDLALRNCPRSFQKSNSFEQLDLDFQKLTVTVVKQYFPKQIPKVITYWDLSELPKP